MRWSSLFALGLLASCNARHVDISVSLPAAITTPAAYELHVYAGACPTDVAPILAGLGGAPLRTIRWHEGETPEAVGRLDGGAYGLCVVVRDAACRAVGYGRASYDGGADSVQIPVVAVGPLDVACDTEEACVDGLCASGADGGVGVPDAGDGGLVDAGPECADPLDCGPLGIGRCSMGACASCAATRMLPVTFPDSAAGFGEQIALETYEIIDEPWSWVALRDNAAGSRLWHRQVPLADHANTTVWDRVTDVDFGSFGGLTVASPDSIALMRDATDPTVWIAAIAEVDGVRQVVSGQMFTGWLYSYVPTEYALGPGFMTRQIDDQVRYGWRGNRDAGGATLRALRANDLVGPTDGMAVVSSDPPGFVAGSDGAFMVASDGADLHFWSPEASVLATRVERTDGLGPAALAFEGGEGYLVAYADGPRVRVRRMVCSGSCGFDPMRPADLVITRDVDVDLVRVVALPDGGAVVAWAETSDAPRVFAQILPSRLDSPGLEPVEVASVAPTRDIRDLAIDTLEHDGEVYVPMVLVAGPPGSGGDFASYFGLRFSRAGCP
ncbi:MAG: hypothetical protein H6719_30255 [Sandaracinaceae bacterium]|nr:hypothetical protein [Sandaracinaceae bacterium]